MKVVAKVAVLGLAGLTAFGAAGCNRDGGSGGTTTIIQPPPTNGGGASASSSSSAAPASVAPIDDPKELCHQVLLKTRGLGNALNAFWKIATTPGGWSFADPATGDAVARVEKESGQVFPALDNIAGKGAPAETAGAVNEYLKTMKEFSNMITEERKDDNLNSASSNYGNAKDKLDSVCSAAS